jgi:RNA-directed DNA polymerase
MAGDDRVERRRWNDADPRSCPGWLHTSKLREELRTIDAVIVRWVSRKYKRFRGHKLAAWDWLRSLKRRNPAMFAHWTLGPAAG